MKKLGLFDNLFLQIEDADRTAFRKKLRKDNVERVYILSCIGILFLVFLLGLDYLRLSSGQFYTDIIFQLLFYNHLSLALLIIPIIIIYKNKERIREGDYKYSLAVIYAGVIYIGLILMTMAILTIINRNAVLVYGLFVLITNFVIIFPHVERLVFNILSLIIIVAVIYINGMVQGNSMTLMYINMLECIGVSLLAYSLSHYLYNDEIKQYNYEKILHEKNLVIEEEKEVSNALAQKLKELNVQKNKLYANITHEFRTPLTVILGMSDRLRSFIKKRDEVQQEEAIDMIERNGITLLNLINEMLDLSKLESGVMKINLVQRDIISFLRYINVSFQSYALSKDIHLSFLTDLESFNMDFDVEKMQQILSNLLSNAIKFTPEAGKISVSVKVVEQNGAETLMVNVKDNGTGIAPEELPYIFDRFYQVDDATTRKQGGSGIGLALTKELVKLMDGEIDVTSEPGQGTEFSVKLPVCRQSEIVSEESILKSAGAIGDHAFSPTGDPTNSETFFSEKKLPLLLIIEDNPDVVHYLKSCLDTDYQLEIAYDGRQGIDKAIEIIPDIIISDVMMPEKDGYEVCEMLKSDERTNHIPIILLTAKVTTADKIAGLERGADAYLAKPFNSEELLLRIRNLIDSRKQLQQKYGKGSLFWESVALKNKPQLSQEESFLHRTNELIKENISNEDFGITQLCRALGMSRSQIHRKIKALTSLSTSIYIRTIRLYKAKELLKTTDLNISEVAYEVGFKDPNYFTHTFVEEFDISPSATRK
jgi:signal transduction histidine kinase/DNA-binding response OmpR family regulator